MSFKFSALPKGIAFTGLLFSSLSVLAQTCSTVQFDPFHVNENGYLLELVSDNGTVIEDGVTPTELIAGSKQHYLAPGWHTFMLLEWPIRDYKEFAQKQATAQANNEPANFIKHDIRQVQLFVRANKHYVISKGNATVNQKVAETSFELTELEADCKPQDQQLVLTSKTQANILTPNLQLPESLEYRLRRVMTEIAQYHQTKTPKVNKSMTPALVVQSFGLVVDAKYRKDDHAIKVLAVSPYSPAGKLGLISGDHIVQFDGVAVSDTQLAPIEQIQHYLNAKRSDEKIDFDIQRNGKRVKLQGSNNPSIIPEIRYQVITTDAAVVEGE